MAKPSPWRALRINDAIFFSSSTTNARIGSWFLLCASWVSLSMFVTMSAGAGGLDAVAVDFEAELLMGYFQTAA